MSHTSKHGPDGYWTNGRLAIYFAAIALTIVWAGFVVEAVLLVLSAIDPE